LLLSRKDDVNQPLEVTIVIVSGSRNRHSFVTVAGVALLIVWASLVVRAQVAVRNQGFVPFSDAPIYYRTTPVTDPVARLQADLDAGQKALSYDAHFGYLPSVLKSLGIPISSQMLVFSKTSFQYRHISPETPRALYFNDDVYIGFVDGGKALELISFDARQGAMFYLLDQQQAARPAFQRAELDCTQCHIAPSTRQVPGVFVRSVFTRPTGTLSTGARTFVTGHDSPFAERFGGWYVTGRHGALRHLGNVVVDDRTVPEGIDRERGANRDRIPALAESFLALTPHSDLVAQLVHAHQTQLHNLITQTNYQARLTLHSASLDETGDLRTLTAAQRARYEGPAEDLVRYLLFAGEAPLGDAVSGSSSFAEEFSGIGPRDRRGRSLRDFDLHERLFRYPCSYLIYTAAFDALPLPARDYVYRRLVEVLSGQDRSAAFARLTDANRLAVREILTDTKPEFALAWSRHAITAP
jgi:hypothetical protein